MSRFIRSQGDLDGACFLYAVFNGAQTLLGKKRSRVLWRRLVEVSNSPVSLLGGDGTRLIDEQDSLLSELVASHLLLLGCAVRVDLVAPLRDGTLPKGIGKNSVLILDDASHWYCVVEVSAGVAYVACSAIWQKDPRKYSEEKSPRLGRHYNRRLEAKDMRYFRGRAFLFTRARA